MTNESRVPSKRLSPPYEQALYLKSKSREQPIVSLTRMPTRALLVQMPTLSVIQTRQYRWRDFWSRLEPSRTFLSSLQRLPTMILLHLKPTFYSSISLYILNHYPSTYYVRPNYETTKSLSTTSHYSIYHPANGQHTHIPSLAKTLTRHYTFHYHYTALPAISKSENLPTKKFTVNTTAPMFT